MGSPCRALARLPLSNVCARNARLARTLRLEAGKVTGRALEAGDDLLLHERIERGVNGFSRMQDRLLAGSGDDDQIADIRRTNVGPQHRIQCLVGRRYRAQCGEFVIPDGPSVRIQNDGREYWNDEQQGAWRPRPAGELQPPQCPAE